MSSKGAELDAYFARLYIEQYGEERLATRPFLNMGSGGFSHKYWRTSDRLYGPNGERWVNYMRRTSDANAPDLAHHFDYTKGKPIGIPDNSLEVVYTSHSLEHTFDQFVLFALQEAFRILRPGGLLRVVVPDARLAYNAYVRRDYAYFEADPSKRLERYVAYHVSLVSHPEYSGPLRKEGLEALFAMDSFEGIMDRLYEESVQIYQGLGDTMGKHVNWFDYNKMAALVARAGFVTAYRSGYAQSACPILRDTRYFDATRPSRSLYLEAVK